MISKTCLNSNPFLMQFVVAEIYNCCCEGMYIIEQVIPKSNELYVQKYIIAIRIENEISKRLYCMYLFWFNENNLEIVHREDNSLFDKLP